MTRIDTPLELTTLRDDDPPTRDRPSGSTLPTRLVALLAIGAAALAAGDAPSSSVGPGRFVLLAVVVAWCVGALVTSVLRPGEPLAALMTLVGGTIALAMLGAAEAANHPTYAVTAVVRAIAIAALPAVGVHLVLGLPDGRLGERVRRQWALVVDVLAAAVAVWCIAVRPELPVVGLVGLSAVAITVAVTGFVARCRRARTQAARARLQWPAWGVLTAAAIALGAVVLDALVGWPTELLALTVAATALFPVALALGAHRSLAVRIDRLLVHTITFGGLAALVAVVALAVVAALGRSLDRGERSVLGLSIAGAATAALSVGPRP